jgi:hypothetical protein
MHERATSLSLNLNLNLSLNLNLNLNLPGLLARARTGNLNTILLEESLR